MKRDYESLLNEYLVHFPCVGPIEPRQYGKTVLLQTLPDPWPIFHLERPADLQVVIDVAQGWPGLFSVFGVAIDAHRREPGRHVVTGSSSADLLQAIS